MRLTDRDVLIDPCYGITAPETNGGFPRVQIRTNLAILFVGLIAFIIGKRLAGKHISRSSVSGSVATL